MIRCKLNQNAECHYREINSFFLIIFGDIDSIAKQLKHQFYKNQLPKVSTPDFSYAFVLWEKILQGKSVEYFKTHPEKWTAALSGR
jgi:hypothetical protein